MEIRPRRDIHIGGIFTKIIMSCKECLGLGKVAKSICVFGHFNTHRLFIDPQSIPKFPKLQSISFRNIPSRKWERWGSCWGIQEMLGFPLVLEAFQKGALFKNALFQSPGKECNDSYSNDKMIAFQRIFHSFLVPFLKYT